MNPRIPHHKVVMFRAPQLYLRVKHPLWFFICHVHPRYTAVRIKNCWKSTSVITVATMKNTDDFHYAIKGSHHVQPPN